MDLSAEGSDRGNVCEFLPVVPCAVVIGCGNVFKLLSLKFFVDASRVGGVDVCKSLIFDISVEDGNRGNGWEFPGVFVIADCKLSICVGCVGSCVFRVLTWMVPRNFFEPSYDSSLWPVRRHKNEM